MGVPVVATVKLNGWPMIAVAVAGLVNAGATGSSTDREKDWVDVATELVAVTVSGYVPTSASVGSAPAIVAVPSPLSVNPRVDGSVPLRLKAGVGSPPVVVTVKLKGSPTNAVADTALVNEA